MAATTGVDRTSRIALAARLRRLDWTLELLVALLVAAETCVVFLVTEAVFSSSLVADRTVSPIWIFLLLYTGTTIQRAMDAYRFFSPEYEIVSLASIALLFLAAVRIIAYPHDSPVSFDWLRDALRGFAFFETRAERPLWGIVALVAYAWWRGRTRDEPSIESAYRIMRAGTPVCVVALIATFTIAPTESDPALRRALFSAVIGFLAAILTAIALGRLRIEHARGTLTITPRWLITFLGPVVGLVAVGTLLAGIFTRRFLDTLIWLLTPVFLLIDLILLIIVYIATGMAWVIFTIFALLARLFGTGEPMSRPAPAGTPAPPPQAFEQTRDITTPDTARYLVALVLLAAIAWLLTRFLWHRRRQRPTVPGEERESVFSWGLLGEELSAFFSGLGGRFARKPDRLAHLRGDPRWQHTVAIRELYGRFLHRGADAELPRADDQTPDEYAPVIAAAGPPPPAVTALTGHYDQARYAAEPATAADAASAKAAWEAIEASRLQAKRRADH